LSIIHLAALARDQIGHRMSEDINQQILTELCKLRSQNQRIFYLLLVIGIMCVVVIPIDQYLRSFPQSYSWDKVTTAMRRQDFPAALSMAQTLVARQPDYYYGRAYLGAIYLAMGDATNAEIQYSRAYGLFPSEENGKDLAAVRKRLATVHDFNLLSK
jgi:cytochrome c-type biogenesis protein CcmH/NrfG